MKLRTIRMRCIRALLIPIALLGLGSPAWSQSTAGDESSDVPRRAALLKRAREAKVDSLHAPERTSVEKGMHLFDEGTFLMGKVRGGWHGLRLAGGDFPSGAGFNYGIGFTDEAVGSIYSDSTLPNRVDIDLIAATSTSNYHQLSADLAFRNLGGSTLSTAFRAKWYEHPQEDFFGLGSTSLEENRTSYLERGTKLEADFWLEPAHGLSVGGGVGYESPGISSGTDPNFPSSEELFDSSGIPGFEEQPDFIRVDGVAAFDWRDKPLAPRSGGRYAIRFSNFKDQDLDSFDFNRVVIDAEQYIPWLQGYRVLALRANIVLTDADPGNDVPFYYMPNLGGGEMLRGFREFRFRDRNSLLLTAEYRWEAWWPLDVALFVDAGKVAPTRSELDLKDLEASYGIGFRFHSSAAVVARVDVGFSREGYILFLRYSHAF